MRQTIEFQTEIYRRDALESAAEKYRRRARISLDECESRIVARLEPLAGGDDLDALRNEFCNEAFSETARRMRATGSDAKPAASAPAEPPWALLAPCSEGCTLDLDWELEALAPPRDGAAMLTLRHPQHGVARVAVRRNGGAPIGVAHTPHLDFLLMNGGGGTAETNGSIGRALEGLALRIAPLDPSSDGLLDSLTPHSEKQAAPRTTVTDAERPGSGRRIAPRIDTERRAITFDLDETGISRLALYDTVLAFAKQCYIFLTRTGSRMTLRLEPCRADLPDDELRVLVRDVTAALNRLARSAVQGCHDASSGLPPLPRRSIDLNALLTELEQADPATLGRGFVPERGPGHEGLRILNIRGTGACNSECVFCIEKFNPTHRPMPKADHMREFIRDGAGNYDMLFFASGEPTIHPKLFEYVDLAREVGFTSFGMSSHFRTFADPRFALRTLQAGFEFFDIALHAADDAGQLDVNPIDDGGRSLWEALHGLANLYRLADALGVRISVTHKIVISKLNATALEPIFRATFERGVRHFILQPVRTQGLAPELQAKLEISEEEIIPHLNDLLQHTEGTGATVKPYGFSRMNLFNATHVETESNRVKNTYGKGMARRETMLRSLTANRDRVAQSSAGAFRIEVRASMEGLDEADRFADGKFQFRADGNAPVLDGALDLGVDLPFGCRMGSCGMCCARLIEGRVDQSSQIFLSEEQIAQGYVLLCQARPLSDVVVELCSDDEIDRL